MKIHKREKPSTLAEMEIREDIIGIAEKYELTMWELVMIMASELSSLAKHGIRDERHPDDSDKPGGVE